MHNEPNPIEKTLPSYQKFPDGISVAEFPGKSFVEIEALEGTELLQVIVSEYYYTAHGTAYYSAYHESSFSVCPVVVFHNGAPLLALASTKRSNAVSWFHFPAKVFCIAQSDERAAVYTELFAFLAPRWKKEGIETLFLHADPFFVNKFFSHTEQVSTKHFGIIDLSVREEKIKTGLRKSYKSLVNWGMKNMQVNVFDSKNISDQVFESFRSFHLQVAGRKTRSDESWHMQAKAIQEGGAFLTCGFLDNELVAATYIECGREEAFYAVGVYNRQLMETGKAIAHYPLIHSVFHAKKCGYRIFNVDNLDVSEDKTEKQNDISFFKKGFVTQVRTETYYKFNFLPVAKNKGD